MSRQFFSSALATSNSFPNRPGSYLEIWEPVATCRSAFFGIAAFSCISNVLMLTGSLFMLEVYDRILPSHSVPSLVVLFALVVGLYVIQGALDVLRTRMMARAAWHFDESLGKRVFQLIMAHPAGTRAGGDGLQNLRNLDVIRTFFGGLGPTTLFDLPWIPLYLAIIFAFHPALGVTALVGALLLIALTWLTEHLTRMPSLAASHSLSERQSIAEDCRRNAEVLAAMGMTRYLQPIWGAAHAKYVAEQASISDTTGVLGGIAKVVRMVLQSGMLALGAYLVINDQASAGIIIASSILTSRALAPVESVIAHWKGFLAARQSWAQLSRSLETHPRNTDPLSLPAPRRDLAVEGVTGGPPGTSTFVIQGVSFTLHAGQCLGIVGPSGSGKSSLARLVAGVWSPAFGTIRLDGASLEQWSPAERGGHIGYLPQDVELFSGTVAQNIARFTPAACPADIVSAAQAADAHEMIVRLPNGYDTVIGEHGCRLSGGQRQRIALARALFGNPFLIILDEPNSNLDQEGEVALIKALERVKARGGIVVLVAHRPSALAVADQVLAMSEGRVLSYGTRDQVLQQLLRPAIVSGTQRKAS